MTSRSEYKRIHPVTLRRRSAAEASKGDSPAASSPCILQVLLRALHHTACSSSGIRCWSAAPVEVKEDSDQHLGFQSTMPGLIRDIPTRDGPSYSCGPNISIGSPMGLLSSDSLKAGAAPR